jgi:hypothetical protein
MGERRVRVIERIVARASTESAHGGASRRWAARALAAWRAATGPAQHPNARLGLLYESEWCALRALAAAGRR